MFVCFVLFWFWYLVETQSHEPQAVFDWCVSKDNLELMIFLCLPPQCGEYRLL